MTPDTQRRFLMFGAGLLIGCVLSIGLFKYASQVQGAREVQRVDVVVTTCDLRAGDELERSCVESRAVEHQFVPPDSMRSAELTEYLGRRLNVALPMGSAVRTVDFSEGEK